MMSFSLFRNKNNFYKNSTISKKKCSSYSCYDGHTERWKHDSKNTVREENDPMTLNCPKHLLIYNLKSLLRKIS